MFEDDQAQRTLAVVCLSRGSLGDFQPEISETTEIVQVVSREQSFRLDADVVDRIKAKVNFAAVESITVKFTRARLLMVTYEKVFEQSAERSPACRDAVASAEAAGREVFMIREALEGDVEYAVTFKAGFDASAQADIMRELAVELSADASTATSTTVIGRRLIWGVKGDRFLGGLRQPPDDRRVQPPVKNDMKLDRRGIDARSVPRT